MMSSKQTVSSILLSSLLLLLYLSHYSVRGYDEHYVMAENGLPCPTTSNSNSLCQHLDFYMSDINFYLASNTTLYFLEGEHVLRQSMVVVSVSNITLQGLGSIDYDEHGVHPSTVISCTEHTHSLVFLHSFDITINGLTIKNCGGLLNHSDDMDLLLYSDFLRSQNSSLHRYASPLTLGFLEVYNLKISEVSIREGTGYGLLAINALDMDIVHSSFVRNNAKCANDSRNLNCSFGGNVALHYTNLFDCASTNSGIYQLNILQTNISLGFSYRDASSLFRYFSSGLLINLNHSPTYGMDVVLEDVVSYGNTASIGANLAFTASSLVSYYTLTINNLKNTHGNMIHSVRPRKAVGGGMLVSIGGFFDNTTYVLCGRPPLDYAATNILMTNIDISDNYGGFKGGLSILKQASILSKVIVEDRIVIKNATLARNIGFLGMGIGMFVNGIVINSPTYFLFQNVTVINSISFDFNSTIDEAVSPSAIYASSITELVIQDLRVIDNEGAGMLAVESLLVVKGVNLIQGNHGSLGGGVSLIGKTHILFDLPARIDFVDNHAAVKGGAIYIRQLALLDVFVCSFDVISTNVSEIGDSGFYFTNNTAGLAGSLLYGGDIDNCLQSVSSNFGAAIFSQLFHLVAHNENDLSMISSDALRVCFCDKYGVPNCSIMNTNVMGLPGSYITVSVAIVGQRSGTTPGTLHVQEYVAESLRIDPFLEFYNDSVCHDYTHYLKFQQVPQNTNTTTSLFDANTILILSAVVPHFGLNTQRSSPISPIMVNITKMDCPIGFELSPFLGICACSSAFNALNAQFDCNISSEEITRDGNVWVGYNEDKDCVITEKCPFNYCDKSSVTFDLNETNPQCNLNHRGMLCGECGEGLSLMLGSNKCAECTYYSIFAMVPVFIIAGLTLVVLISVLNLTVSQGTINGLIFLANIIKLAEFQFFPRGPIPLLSQFISWINLDLGIETCFFAGLNAYYKIWLQYLFPFYIWFLVWVVIRLANCYGRFSRLIGRQAIPVLSTLVLLSYTKLFRTITLSLHSVRIECGNSTLPLAWNVDPNVKYFGLEHSILFGFSLVVLIFLALPYTLFLLFNPLIEKHLSIIKNRKLQKRLQSVWQRLKPFVDAYNGPFKDETRFWTGLLLLTRIIILLTVAFADDKEIVPAVIIFMLVLLFGVSMSVGGVYNKRHCSALGAWYLVLLAAMSCAVASGYGYVGTIVGLTLALLTFIVVLCYHVYLRVNKNKRVTNSIRKRLLPISVKGEESSTKNIEESTDDIFKSVEKSIETLDVRQRFDNIPSVELFRRRESLIYDDDDYSVEDATANTCNSTSTIA